MRLIKTLGLAALAATVATAFVGVSTASATVENIILCEKAELICTSPYPNPTEIHAEDSEPVFLTNLGNMECEESLALLTLLNELAKLMQGHLLELTFTGCKLGETACLFIVTEIGGFSFEATDNPEEKLLASVTAIPFEEKETKITIKCGFFVNCTLKPSEETELTAHSDEEGHLLLSAVKAPLASLGFACPSIVQWDATYHAVNLDEELTLKTNLWIEG